MPAAADGTPALLRTGDIARGFVRHDGVPHKLAARMWRWRWGTISRGAVQ